jgi:hypothetical protein
MSILLYRNYFYPGSDSNEALRHFLPVVISSAIGYGAAAWLTPIVTRRLSNSAWIATLLAAGGVVTVVFGLPFGQIGFIIIGFGLGIVAQGLAICVTTILQQQMADDYRGRVFSVYDMLFNVTFVLGAAVSAAFMPDTGRSVPMLLTVAIGYLVAAVAYWFIAGQPRGAASPASAGPSRPSGPSGPSGPSAPSAGPSAPDGAAAPASADSAPADAAPVAADPAAGSPESRAQRSSS